MTLNDFFSGMGLVLGPVFLVVFFMFIMFVMPSFFSEFSAERRLERFVDQKCIEGNEIAIKIRRERIYIICRDAQLIRAAIDGNQNAIKALRLDEKVNHYFK